LLATFFFAALDAGCFFFGADLALVFFAAFFAMISSCSKFNLCSEKEPAQIVHWVMELVRPIPTAMLIGI
jgi:hypothetical protein